MTTTREERRANKDYTCNACGKTIEAGSQYICVTHHSICKTPVKNSKKLYHGTVYHNIQHINSVERYHIECN